LASSSPIYGKGFRSGTSENQRLHTNLGNSRTKKASLKQELIELRSQLETERTDREEIEAELSPAKTKFCSGHHSFPKINTRRGHNSQPAPSQT
jgi:chromosome segregation ATPase